MEERQTIQQPKRTNNDIQKVMLFGNMDCVMAPRARDMNKHVSEFDNLIRYIYIISHCEDFGLNGSSIENKFY